MRVKGGFTKRKKHKKILNLVKGQKMGRSKIYRLAHQALLHSGQYAFVGRKKRKRDFRKLWIQRISATVKNFNLNYSTFTNLLKKAKINLNRKMLSEIAIKEPEAFKKIIDKVKSFQ